VCRSPDGSAIITSVPSAVHHQPDRRRTAPGAEGKVDLPPGSIEYIDDLTGKGQHDRERRQGTRVSIQFSLTDQKQVVGPMGNKK
jgi:hypothetical protein